MIEMIKNKVSNLQIGKTFSIIESILRHFKEEESEKFEINKGLIRIRQLFQGHAVKV